MNYTLSDDLAFFQKRINNFIQSALKHYPNARLTEAMAYAVLLGGKRVRPFLIYATGRMLGVSLDKLDTSAAAMESIHAYSLVHDDLPAMDDDALRRGNPTCHIAFDEATAILAGDALQSLAFYNAIANGGVMVKPRMMKEVKEWNKTIEKFNVEIINGKVCSKQTADKAKGMLADVVRRSYGSGHRLYSPDFSMAGKTGTARKNYANADSSKLSYISSFAGFFPVDTPKYSCIVVIHEPDRSVGIYGADVSGPVFKSIAHKM